MANPVPDATTEAKNIAAKDHQAGKNGGAEAAAAALNKDYDTYMQQHGNNVAESKQWLQQTTAQLAKDGVLPDITIGVLNGEMPNLSSDGKTLTSQDLTRDNFLLGGSSGTQQSFDSVFTNEIVNNTSGLSTGLNKELGSKNGTYTTSEINKFQTTENNDNQNAANQNNSRGTDAGLYQTLPGSNPPQTVLQYLDGASGSGSGTHDGQISSADVQTALDNPLLPAAARKSIEALQTQFSKNDWGDRSVSDILKQDGVTLPPGTPDVKTDPNGYYAAVDKAYKQANLNYQNSITEDTSTPAPAVAPAKPADPSTPSKPATPAKGTEAVVGSYQFTSNGDGTYSYKIASGDNLTTIADAIATNAKLDPNQVLQSIESQNQSTIPNPNAIEVGQTIVIPAADAAEFAASQSA